LTIEVQLPVNLITVEGWDKERFAEGVVVSGKLVKWDGKEKFSSPTASVFPPPRPPHPLPPRPQPPGLCM